MKPGSGELNPLCGTILPTSATPTELIQLHYKGPPFLIHMETILKVKM